MFEDVETTFPQLQDRIARTIAFVEGIDPARFEGDPDRPLVLKMAGQEFPFTAQTFLFGFVLPNLYFQCATAYNILRHNGVAVGKRDFLGGL